MTPTPGRPRCADQAPGRTDSRRSYWGRPDVRMAEAVLAYASVALGRADLRILAVRALAVTRRSRKRLVLRLGEVAHITRNKKWSTR